ncbi:MAG: methyltransferase [Alphaproteobacteria bacterium]
MADDTVRAQYEAYPYPARNPSDENARLITGSPSHLAEINHYIFAGRRDFSQPFRALVAGGGTGDGLIMLAQHLADAGVPAEIVYLDLSTASRATAEARAKQRGLTSVDFRTGSLLDAPSLGRFDYIDCCGVLHHLDEPQCGFRALADALGPGGGMGLMVYGAYGRTGVYPLQDALRQLTADSDPPDKKVALARTLIDGLPPTNWFLKNRQLGDHRDSDAGLYDLLLHSTDRAYTVDTLWDEIEAAGLSVASFIEPARYDPSVYLGDKTLAGRAAELDRKNRAVLAERLAGNMAKHIVYCVPEARGETVAKDLTPSAIPVPRDGPFPASARGLGTRGPLPIEMDGLKLSLPLPPLAGEILVRCDGVRTLDEIRKDLPGRPDWFAFKPQIDAVFRSLGGFNKLLVRYI